MNPLYLFLPAMGAFCCPSSHDPGVVCMTSKHFRVVSLISPAASILHIYTQTRAHTEHWEPMN